MCKIQNQHVKNKKRKIAQPFFRENILSPGQDIFSTRENILSPGQDISTYR